MRLLIVQFFRLLSCLGLLLLSASALWSKNHVHDPSYIFEAHPSGFRAINPSRATKAAFVHSDGVKGQLKNGTPLKAAIIDCSFNPNYTKLLADKGVIHPDALQPGNPYCLAPNENFNESTVYYNRNNELNSQQCLASSQEERDQIQRQIDQLKPLLDAENEKNAILRLRKNLYDDVTKKDAITHGSGVMEVLHLVAPEAQLLPIDMLLFSDDQVNTPEAQIKASDELTKAIRMAIAHRVNVVNISFSLSEFNQEAMGVIANAIADAVRQGIVFCISAGNDSRQGLIHRISDVWDAIKGAFVKSNKQKLFEGLQGKGILFAGALGYNRNGEEEVSSFSQLPDASTKRRFLLAPGVDIPVRAKCDSNRLVHGTSFSSPVVAGGYLLLLQHALDKGYHYESPELLLDILQDSGKNVTYKRWWPFSNEEYKSIDLDAAQKLLDKKFIPVVSEPAPKSPAVRRVTVRRATSKSPAVRRVTVRRAASKRPAVRRVTVRRAASKRPAVKRAVPQKPKSRRFRRR